MGLASNNILSPATGEPIVTPSEDMVFAFEDKRLSLHEWVWVRFNGEVEDEDEMRNPQKTEELEDGSRLEIWNLRRDRLDSQNNLISRFVLTTVGRVVMNDTIIDSVTKI